jgi:A/G-specific adenine glycosylase
VFARAVDGVAQAAPTLTRAETGLADELLPENAGIARTWGAAIMEVGAVICSARSPRCPECPVSDLCAGQRAGKPTYQGPTRRSQPWHGTDRQCRGPSLPS